MYRDNFRPSAFFVLAVSLLALHGCEFKSTGTQQLDTVTLSYGTVKGSIDKGVVSFKGIPYASPPTGSNRWKPPSAPYRLNGVLEANAFGPACLQPMELKDVYGIVETSEDCLTLNVWSPQTSDTEPKPVLVWIHGGGFRFGSGNIDADSIARRGVVVVSFNYRLGPMGFFAHDELNENVSSFAVLDMIQALNWIKSNIRKFGGDPNNVTIFGISAGGMAVNLLMTNRTADGLFHKAIAQSAYGTWPLPRSRSAPKPPPLDWNLEPIASAEENGAALLKAIEYEERPIRQADGQTLIDSEPVNSFTLPIVDGAALPEEPGLAFLRGHQAKVPYISGGTSFEGSIMPYSGVATERYRDLLGPHLNPLTGMYVDDFSDDEDHVIRKLFGEHRYLLSARVLGGAMNDIGSPAWLYYLDIESDELALSLLGGRAGAGTPHGGDFMTMFKAEAYLDHAVLQASEQVWSLWIRFARKGNPNSTENTLWPEYSIESRQWLTIGTERIDKTQRLTNRLDHLEQLYLSRISPAMPSAEQNHRQR